MPEDPEIPKPRPPDPEPSGPGQLPGPEPGDPRGRPIPKPRHRDTKFDPLREAGDFFSKLGMDLIDAVNTSGGFEPGGHNGALRPVLRATADNFAAVASDRFLPLAKRSG